MRREMERKEVERRIEKLLMAGGTSATKMIEKVLAASPRVRGLAGPGAGNGDRQPVTCRSRPGSFRAISKSPAAAAAVIGLATKLLKLNEEGRKAGGMKGGPEAEALRVTILIGCQCGDATALRDDRLNGSAGASHSRNRENPVSGNRGAPRASSCFPAFLIQSCGQVRRARS